MSILIALFLSLISFSWATKPTREAAPSYPLHCKLKAVAGPIEVRMDSTGQFSWIMELQGRKFTCGLKPLKVTRVKDEVLVPGEKPEGKYKTVVGFSRDLICDPKDVPPSFLKNLSLNMEWIIREKTSDFFVEAGEPAAPCAVIQNEKKQVRSVLEAVSKKLAAESKKVE